MSCIANDYYCLMEVSDDLAASALPSERDASTDHLLEGSMHFSIQRYPKESLDIMNTLRQCGKLCDVTLTAGSESFPAHKLVLVAASPYFRSMFCTSGMRESELQTIPLRNVSPSILATLIEFAYTSEIQVSERNVCSLLSTASMLQMGHIVEACCTFLERQLDASNCIGIADFASIHGARELYEKAKRFVYKNFGDVCQHQEFLELSHTQLLQVIRRDELNVRCESEVYGAVVRWVSHGERERTTRLEQLLSAVRCHFLTPCFLRQQLTKCEMLKKVPACHEYLSRIFQDLTLHKRVTEKRRSPVVPPVVYTVGGYFRHSIGNVECFNPVGNNWFKLADLGSPRSGLAACTLHCMLYIVGGRNNSPEGNSDSSDVDCFDPFSNMWRKCASMSVPRNRVGCGSIDGLLFAVGGSCDSTFHSSVEQYNPDNDSWTNVAPMSTARLGVGVASLNRLLYAVGGYDGTTRLNTVERFDPDNGDWRSITPMSVARSGAGVIALDQYIYAVGGYDGANQLASVERYDIETNQWDLLTSMAKPRSALGVAIISNKIYAVGGYDGTDFLSSVECYNIDREEWQEVTIMNCGRSGHGVAVAPEPCPDRT